MQAASAAANRQTGDLSAPAGSAAGRVASNHTAGSIPIQAALVAMDDGFRLIVRLPSLSDEEQVELSKRLTELFAQMGETPPELVIHRSAMSSEGD
ncbi:hypothetical protein [Pelagerythrobacter marensis]|nr:hypothetical protein [Pelagerythrobacter marensis]